MSLSSKSCTGYDEMEVEPGTVMVTRGGWVRVLKSWKKVAAVLLKTLFRKGGGDIMLRVDVTQYEAAKSRGRAQTDAEKKREKTWLGKTTGCRVGREVRTRMGIWDWQGKARKAGRVMRRGMGVERVGGG